MAGSGGGSGREIGFVEIATERANRPLQEMLEYAKAEARKMGGNVLADVTYDAVSTGSGSSYTTPIRDFRTGKVIAYSTSSSSSVRRTLRARILRRSYID